VPEHGFHEVYRVVPGPQQAAGNFPHNQWEESPEKTINLPSIDIPRTPAVEATMVRVEGGVFMMGANGRKGQPRERTMFGPAHRREVAPYHLDPTELTVEAYRAKTQTIPAGMKTRYVKPPPNFDRFPVTHLNWERARNVAEQMGKRLPTEEEYEFAATSRGRWAYPWGDDEEKTKDIVWEAGPVGQPEFDCVTLPGGRVFGLYSNVAEWTDSRFTLYSPRDHPARLRTMQLGDVYFARWQVSRSVRGAPSTEVLPGPFGPAQRTRELADGVRGRFSFETTGFSPNLGFRCARSARPRFLD
jgi:formylglycine-generating enzyme required for sulfatase activity